MGFASSTSWQNNDDEGAFRHQFWRKTRRVAASLPFAEDLLAAYYCAFDRGTPLAVKTSLVERSPTLCCLRTLSRMFCRSSALLTMLPYWRPPSTWCRAISVRNITRRRGTSSPNFPQRIEQSSRSQNNLAHDLPRRDCLERGGCFCKRINCVHVRRQLSFHAPGQQLLHVGAMCSRVTLYP